MLLFMKRRSHQMIRLAAVLHVLYAWFAAAAPSSIDERIRGNKDKIPESKSRVIGGFPAIEGKFPYGRVSLRKQNDRHQCGGTVVAPDMILTAGHCIGVFDHVEVGEYDRTDTAAVTQTFDVLETILHPAYEADYYRFDVMLVKLIDASVTGVEPVRLNEDDQVPSGPPLLTVIGWGSINNPIDSSERTFPDVLQQALVPYVPNDICENTEYQGNQLYLDEIFDEMLCAGREGVDACRGDSGSPLIQESIFDGDVQVGLVSWGRGCGKYPGVYVRISKVFPWIREQICWYSASPPTYLACQAQERPPSPLPTSPPQPTTNAVGSAENDTATTNGLDNSPDVIETGPNKGLSFNALPATSGTYRLLPNNGGETVLVLLLSSIGIVVVI